MLIPTAKSSMKIAEEPLLYSSLGAVIREGVQVMH
jgi:hypothetical protein